MKGYKLIAATLGIGAFLLLFAAMQYALSMGARPHDLSTDSDAYVRRACALIDANQYADLRTLAKEWMEAIPTDANAWGTYGIACFALKDYPEAARGFEEACVLTPNVPALWRSLGESLELSGNPSDAAKAFNEGVKIAPRDDALWGELSRAQYESKNVYDAIRSAQTALSINPRNPDALMTYGVIWVDRGNYKEAIALYERLKSVSPALAEELVRRFGK
ncbi:tetratricopeptide repeat protein [Verrucomicrobium sp. 3C]|uniref:tetratricopeptide repeat protein n=1 Tax=Verrucomicrobium sp. 3C TaxID=1134055 RepID=UPI00036427D0|nr:tetratricopeptide repeat protein [Verrucomicrobium sp. 3C]